MLVNQGFEICQTGMHACIDSPISCLPKTVAIQLCPGRHDVNSPTVIFGLIISGSFFMSAMAARGMPQLATGPQKCCINQLKISVLYSSIK